MIQDKSMASKTALISHIIHNIFYITDTHLPELSNYYTRFWNAKYVCEQIKDGYIIYQEKKYKVAFWRTDLTSICDNLKAYKHTGVKLSFREARAEYGIQPVVLITINKGINISNKQHPKRCKK